jgi:hypothetical protein
VLAISIEKITEADLQTLIDVGEQESQTLEFKRNLPDTDNSSKQEFCADVCAMANASGGDLILGIDENGEAKAAAFSPSAENPDTAQRRLQQIIESGVEPRIPGLQARAVSVGGGCILVVRVPKSWIGPHWVKATRRFVVREGARKRPLDIPEIRSAFLRSEGQAAKIRNFRADRIGNILTQNTPLPLRKGPVGVLHIVPTQPSSPNFNLDPLMFRVDGEHRLPLLSIGAPGVDFRINLDGALQFRPVREEGTGAYTLVFRDGQVEAVRVFTGQMQDGAPIIPSAMFEQELLEFYEHMTREMRLLSLGPPFAVLYSLLHVGAAILHQESMQAWSLGEFAERTFDRDLVLLPEVVIEQEEPAQVALRPILDLVWQSTGYACSPNYDTHGNWHPR